MNRPYTKRYIWGLIAVLVGTLSLSNVSAEPQNSGNRGKNSRSELSCNPSSQILTYDGEELSCEKIGLIPNKSLVGGEYNIAPRGQIEGDIWGLQEFFTIEGGHLNTQSGHGQIQLSQNNHATITFVFRDPEFLAITLELAVFGAAPTSFSGILDATAPGSNIYEGDLEDIFGNTLTFDFPGLVIFK